MRFPDRVCHFGERFGMGFVDTSVHLFAVQKKPHTWGANTMSTEQLPSSMARLAAA